ncbi:macro domain-containing protein [Lignipirellula cremea]|uniref:Macro domain protein n=1 Tax=Lignipirellula cremea TaxID=2528010 RepID=A0A518DW15_9BACT|nr:macro domain-containing protein [Lignipirellula cremea]QDU96031.1 Macro domain protein [Lignipirellula cremea]
MITYLQGDATEPAGDGPKILCQICNDTGGWGKGFVVAISRRWKAPENAYRDWYQHREENDFALGAVQFVPATDMIEVANMIGQHGTRSKQGEPPIRYEAVRECLRQVGEHAVRRSASLHMPRIGCGLAGGEWSEIEKILGETIPAEVAVTVYDFE